MHALIEVESPATVSIRVGVSRAVSEKTDSGSHGTLDVNAPLMVQWKTFGSEPADKTSSLWKRATCGVESGVGSAVVAVYDRRFHMDKWGPPPHTNHSSLVSAARHAILKRLVELKRVKSVEDPTIVNGKYGVALFEKAL